MEQVTAGRTVHCAAFAGSGAVPVRVEVSDPITSVQVSPASLGVAATVDGSSARFTLPHSTKVIVFVVTAAGALDPLYLLVDEPEVDPPTSSTPNVQYFAAGTHDAGEITLTDGGAVYLAAGALVTGRVVADGAKNLSVGGRGILRGPDDHDSVIRLNNCTGVTVEGISVRNPFGVWTSLFDGCTNVTARNLSVFSFAVNGDGIDPVGCTNVTIDKCLISTGDDCIAIKSMGANVADIEVSGSVLETYPSTGAGEGGDCVKIGTESDCDEISGIRVHDCDVVRCYGESSWGGSAALSILPKGDTVHVHDVHYANIRVESRLEHADFQIRLLGSGTVSDVTLTNITWDAAQSINLVGPVTNVNFTGCTVAGKPLTAAQVHASEGAQDPQL
ncbi:MAG TPA: glycosyl hydrolase family 28 protein [Pseudonocardia sp.]